MGFKYKVQKSGPIRMPVYKEDLIAAITEIHNRLNGYEDNQIEVNRTQLVQYEIIKGIQKNVIRTKADNDIAMKKQMNNLDQ